MKRWAKLKHSPPPSSSASTIATGRILTQPKDHSCWFHSMSKELQHLRLKPAGFDQRQLRQEEDEVRRKAEEEAAPEEPEETTEWSVDDPGGTSPLRAVREEWPADA